jgi:hypothetical protein
LWSGFGRLLFCLLNEASTFDISSRELFPAQTGVDFLVWGPSDYELLVGFKNTLESEKTKGLLYAYSVAKKIFIQPGSDLLGMHPLRGKSNFLLSPTRRVDHAQKTSLLLLSGDRGVHIRQWANQMCCIQPQQGLCGYCVPERVRPVLTRRRKVETISKRGNGERVLLRKGFSVDRPLPFILLPISRGPWTAARIRL